MHVEGEIQLFDEALPERTPAEQRKPSLFFPSLAVFEVMGQIRRTQRVLSSSADMMLRASDSLQVTATGPIYALLLQRQLCYRQQDIKSTTLPPA